jgi:DNA-binding transcriptional ArsR family regulator
VSDPPDVDLAFVARLIGEPARAAMLEALVDEPELSAGDLAARAGIAASTARGHLAALLDANLVSMTKRGRQRRFRLAGPPVAEALEALARVAPPRPVRTLRDAVLGEAVRAGRTCYDHLAGRLGVGLTETLARRRVLVLRDECYDVTPKGERALADLGVDVEAARSARRAFGRACLDWSERRPHLAGALGAAITGRLFELGWVERRGSGRIVAATPAGAEGLHAAFGFREDND